MTVRDDPTDTPAAEEAAGIPSDLFHNCALAGTWPESEAVRRRAYALYERELSRGRDDSALPKARDGPCSAEHDATTTGRDER